MSVLPCLWNLPGGSPESMQHTMHFSPRMTMTFSTNSWHAPGPITENSSSASQYHSTSIYTPVPTHRFCVAVHIYIHPKRRCLVQPRGTHASLDTGATTGAAEWGSGGAAGRALECGSTIPDIKTKMIKNGSDTLRLAIPTMHLHLCHHTNSIVLF